MPTVNNDATYALAREMQRLWVDQAVWTRLYMVAALHGRPEAEEAVARLLQNQEELGRAIGEHYGTKVGAQLSLLLKQHVMIAVDLIEAAADVDRARFHEIDARWSANAQDIAALLSRANPMWAKHELLDRLFVLQSLTKRELAARLEENFDNDVVVFDQIISVSFNVADAFTDGIVRDRADKFAA
jgi:hypothetical protein